MTKPRKTDEERQAEAQQLHERMAEQVTQMRSSKGWARFLKAAASFHAYSINNVLLIVSQCEQATQVAGFRKWQELGRQVRKGERAIKIWAPMTVKATETDKDSGEDVQTKRTIFRPVSVFDISSTDPIEGAEEQSVSGSDQVQGEDRGQIFGRLSAYLHANGWSVERQPLTGGREGYSTADGTHQVVIKEHVSPAHAAAVLLHEAGHITLGHCDSSNSGEYAAHRGAWEVAAESVAYVLGGMLDLDTTPTSIRYVAGWTDGPEGDDALRSTAAGVLKAVHTLYEAMSDTHEDRHEAVAS